MAATALTISHTVTRDNALRRSVEMAENLVRRGLGVTVVEMLDQVMPPLDPEMAAPVRQHLEKNGVSVALGNGVAGFESGPDGAIVVNTKSGAKHTGDIVILAIGVRPETGLAKTAGLDIGERGGIRVDDQMRTNDPHMGRRRRHRDTRHDHWPADRHPPRRTRESSRPRRRRCNQRAPDEVPRNPGHSRVRRLWPDCRQHRRE